MTPARTFGLLEHKPKRSAWVLRGAEPHVVIHLKRFFPKIRVSQGDDFTFQDEPAVCADLVWFMVRWPFAMSQADSLRMKGQQSFYESELRELDCIMSPVWKAGASPPLRPGQVIRRYQMRAVSVLALKKGLLLADDVGLGKTYTAAGFLVSQPGALPAAVVVDAHLGRQWKRRLEEITHLRVHVIESTKPYSLPEADVYVFRWSNVLGWSTIFKTGFFRAVVYDEIHALRNGQDTERGKACHVLSKHAAYRLGLTATPVLNYGIEIWNILCFLFPTNPLGAKDEFVREWCGGDSKRVKNPDALGAFLREHHLLLKRSKHDQEVAEEIVGPTHERVNSVVKEIPYDFAAERRVEDMARMLAIRTVSGPFVERGQAARDLDILLRQATGVAKAKGVANFVRILAESGRKVLLAGWHRDVYDIWNKELADLKPVMYTGSETVAGKNKSEDAFVSGDAKVMIISLRSGAGLDSLQRSCHTLVIGEFDWSNAWHKQLVGRLDREGQDEPFVDAFFLFANGGSDPSMMELLGIKQSQAHGIVNPHAAIEVVQSDESRIAVLARDWLARRGVSVDEAGTVHHQRVMEDA